MLGLREGSNAASEPGCLAPAKGALCTRVRNGVRRFGDEVPLAGGGEATFRELFWWSRALMEAQWRLLRC